jgi:hypothetical protein
MILQQFHKVLQIDSQIAKMHAELLKLYQERADIVDSKGAGSLPKAPSNKELDFAKKHQSRLAKLRAVKGLVK